MTKFIHYQKKTKQTLENLNDIITADVFLVGDYPAEIENLKNLFMKN